MIEEIVVNNRKYKVSEFHGEVVDQQVSETMFSRSSSHRNEYGQYVSSNVSGTHATKEFFLVNQQGEERAYSFTNLPIPPIRHSHIGQVIHVKKENDKNYRLVLIRNVTLNTEYLRENEIEQLCLNSKNVVQELSLVAVGLFCIFFSLWYLLSFLLLDGGFGSLILAIIAAPIAVYIFRSSNNRFTNHQQLLTEAILSKRI